MNGPCAQTIVCAAPKPAQQHAPDLPVRLLLTERGRETWLLFCQRGGRYPEDLTDI